jgi:predicted RNA polymerase sigma factor
VRRQAFCHPAIALDNRVALTLKTVAGLRTAEIARALLVSESTLSQRLLRTKQKIADAGYPLPGASRRTTRRWKITAASSSYLV